MKRAYEYAVIGCGGIGSAAAYWLARRFDVDATILGGTVETIGQQRVGQLQITLAGPRHADALAYLRDQGVGVEIA